MTKMEARYSKLRKLMAENGLDAIYVNSPENHLYMSEFDNPDGHIVITREKSFVFADPRYIEAAKAESCDLCTVCLPENPTLAEIVRDYGIKTIGYEDMRITCAELDDVKKSVDGMGAEFCPLGKMFTEIRSIKTDDEIDASNADYVDLSVLVGRSNAL